MNHKEPPSLATWMLLHLTPGPRNEALCGDLFEEIRSGRSSAWYWRQVLAVIVTACLNEMANHSFLLLFAALWSMLAPAWDPLISKIEHNPAFFGFMWNLAWPWSAYAAAGLFLVAGSVFIWTGIFLYTAIQSVVTRSFSVHQIGRSITMSLCAFIGASGLIFALPMLLPASGHVIDKLGFASSITPDAPHYERKKNIYYTYRYTRKIDRQTGRSVIARSVVQINANDFYLDSLPEAAPRTPLTEIKDTSVRSAIIRMPYFFGVLCALWSVSSRANKRGKTIAT